MLWWDPDDVPHCRILSADRTEWRLISATLWQSADEDAVSWLTSYGSWHAYKKKKIDIISVNFMCCCSLVLFKSIQDGSLQHMILSLCQACETCACAFDVCCRQLKSPADKKSVVRKTIASLTLPNDPPLQVKISCSRHTVRNCCMFRLFLARCSVFCR